MFHTGSQYVFFLFLRHREHDTTERNSVKDAFLIPFQNQSTFWLVGGENVLIDGGGTLDGQGQVRVCRIADGFPRRANSASRLGTTLCRC